MASKGMRYLLIIVMLFATLANAEVYRWTDENGKVHFSDRSVPDNAERVELRDNRPQHHKVVSQDAGTVLYQDVRNSKLTRITRLVLVQETENSAIFDVSYYLDPKTEGKVFVGVYPDMKAWSVTRLIALPGTHTASINVGLSRKADTIEYSKNLRLVMRQSVNGKSIGTLFQRQVKYRKNWYRQ